MAAGNTYVPIATTTLSTTTASVTFSSIPSTYTDLVIVVSGLAYYPSNTYIVGDIILNGDTATNYSSTQIGANGTAAFSSRYTSSPAMRQLFEMTANSTDNNFRSNGIIHFMNYANSTTYKNAIGRSGTLDSSAGSEVISAIGMWRSTAAITSIQLKNKDSATGFIAGTFSLYGIAAA